MPRSDEGLRGDTELVKSGVGRVRAFLAAGDEKYEWYGLAMACGRIANEFAIKKDTANAVAWGEVAIEVYDRTLQDPYFQSVDGRNSVESAQMIICTFLIAMLGPHEDVSRLLDPKTVAEWLERSVRPWGGPSGLRMYLARADKPRGDEFKGLINLRSRLEAVVPLIEEGQLSADFETWRALKLGIDKLLGMPR